jgi:hypothetical protein
MHRSLQSGSPEKRLQEDKDRNKKAAGYAAAV